jgi:hypothetical protein
MCAYNTHTHTHTHIYIYTHTPHTHTHTHTSSVWDTTSFLISSHSDIIHTKVHKMHTHTHLIRLGHNFLPHFKSFRHNTHKNTQNAHTSSVWGPTSFRILKSFRPNIHNIHTSVCVYTHQCVYTHTHTHLIRLGPNILPNSQIIQRLTRCARR